MSTTLATTTRPQFDAPAIFGSRDEIAAVADRMRVMLPSARLQDWQLGEKYRAAAERNLDESLYRAAQLCVFYRLVPGQDVHLIPFQNGWAVDTGIESWKRAADRYCARHGIAYHIHTIAMPADELRQRRDDLYDPEDVGVIAYLWRSDKVQVYEIFGAEQAMTKGYGVWAKKARFDKGDKTWKPDNIPAQRAKEDVAQRRAMKMALKIEFSLDSLLADNPQEARQNLDTLERRVVAVEMDHAPLQRTEQATEDGLFYAVPAQVVDMEEVEFMEGTPDADFDDPFADDSPVSGAAPDLEAIPPALDYRATAARLEGNAARLAEWAKNKHASSDGPASDKQYKYLAGVLDKLTGVKGSHGDLLGILIGRKAEQASPPGGTLAGLLLDYVVKERTEIVDGKKTKVANPQYRQDIADMLVAVWHVAHGI